MFYEEILGIQIHSYGIVGAGNLWGIKDFRSINVRNLNDLDKIIIINRLQDNLGLTFLSFNTTALVLKIGGPENRAIHVV